MSYQSLPVSVEYDEHGDYDLMQEGVLPWTFNREQNLEPHLADMAGCWQGHFIVVLTYNFEHYTDNESYDYVYIGSDGKYRLLDISENMGVEDVIDLDTPTDIIETVLSRMEEMRMKGEDRRTRPVKLEWGTQSSMYEPTLEEQANAHIDAVADSIVARAKDRVFLDKGGKA